MTQMQTAELLIKQQQFSLAISRYETLQRYRWFARSVSLVNVCLQAYLLYLVLPRFTELSPLTLLLTGLAALYLTDLINGFVHMVMDNYAGYQGPGGPLVANFHLHHKTPLYKRRPLPVIYFIESGSKVWLVLYLALVLIFSESLPAYFAVGLVLIGVLSSIAEVSHYLCHTSRSPLVKILMQTGLLLSKKHHARHHTEDNTNYAFLNGWSDPLLNKLADSLYSGYKRGTDQHYAEYASADAAKP